MKVKTITEIDISGSIWAEDDSGVLRAIIEEAKKWRDQYQLLSKRKNTPNFPEEKHELMIAQNLAVIIFIDKFFEINNVYFDKHGHLRHRGEK